MDARQVREDLLLFNLRQTMEGFDPFVGSWILTGEPCVVVDVGPTASVHLLIDFLRTRNVRRVDYVLLSHIHIDHAGGIGPFLQAFPEARVVVHERGLRHLVDPGKLWQGSLQTLGNMAESYGQITPAPERALIPHTDAHIDGLTVLETPGHAVHHLSFVYRGILFAGEAAGVYLPDLGEEYLRPPTPPRFLLEQAVESVDRMLGAADMDICYAHFGHRNSSHEMLARYREQLYLWRDIIETEYREGQGDDLPDRCLRALLAGDPALSAYGAASEGVRARESYFIRNSARGYIGYLAEREKRD